MIKLLDLIISSWAFLVIIFGILAIIVNYYEGFKDKDKEKIILASGLLCELFRGIFIGVVGLLNFIALLYHCMEDKFFISFSQIFVIDIIAIIIIVYLYKLCNKLEYKKNREGHDLAIIKLFNDSEFLELLAEREDKTIYRTIIDTEILEKNIYNRLKKICGSYYICGITSNYLLQEMTRIMDKDSEYMKYR